MGVITNPLSALHTTAQTELAQRSWKAALSVGILSLALAVILCASCACLAPGINASSRIVYPVILPCLALLCLTLPLFITNSRQGPAYQNALEAMVQRLPDIASLSSTVPKATDDKEDLALSPLAKALYDLLPERHSTHYDIGLCTALKERFPKKTEDLTEKKLIEGLDELIAHLYHSKNA